MEKGLQAVKPHFKGLLVSSGPFLTIIPYLWLSSPANSGHLPCIILLKNGSQAANQRF
jgi:hypothetical protein